MIDGDAVAATERSVRDALPAAAEIAAGDWLFRVSGGPTKRVNSATPIVPGARGEPVVAAAEATYRAHGQPTRFRLTPLADDGVDALLAARGYRRIDDSLTMTAPLAGHAIDPAVRLAPGADAAWCAGLAAVSGWSHEADRAHRALLARIGTAAVAAMVEDGRPVGHGIASLAHGRACLFDVAMAAPARGRGVARRLVATLLGWAAVQGAGEAVLQVLAANVAARRLYHSLGFTDAYPYHYRVEGSGEQRGDLDEVRRDRGDA